MAKVKRAARRGTGKVPGRGAPKRKRPAGAVRDAAAISTPSVTVEDQLIASSLSLHELFQQQARQILDRTDLEEEQKQHILVAMSCPCCGAGAMAFTAKLRR